MTSLDHLDPGVIARAARHLAAVSFTHPGTAPTRAVSLIDSVYTRAQIRAERRHARHIATGRHHPNSHTHTKIGGNAA
ncbi:hypothetical protein [Mycolicibacterium sp.]|uniref:hypothetical protein n=1 Tax=Mycolicibacterium sp. TaxID=2320850 RepID=UPI0037CB0ABF